MSQQKLGRSIGLTFQQIQKYEKGINQISAGRLFEIARVLGVPISFFYDDLTATNPSSPPNIVLEERLLPFSQGVQLNWAFARIKDNRLRKHLLGMVEAVATVQSVE